MGISEQLKDPKIPQTYYTYLTSGGGGGGGGGGSKCEARGIGPVIFNQGEGGGYNA